MKSNEREILEELNKVMIGEPLEESSYTYNRFDAENKNYIVEIKDRYKKYNETLIEFDKYSYNLVYSEKTKKHFIYSVRMENCIYVFNITKLNSSNYNFNWEWRHMPYNTEFGNNEPTKKLVGYLNINDCTRRYEL
tara:strand:- start:16764 stop:17171 length:408 start_codon:yes stop_codon:yes gene_type:complete